MSIMKKMEGLTLTEMSQILELPPKTVERRIQRAGFKPITREAIYATEVLEAIRNVPGRGRPPKTKQEAPDKTTKKGKK
jgi:hypothetical protein